MLWADEWSCFFWRSLITLLDHFLLHGKRGKLKYPEGRGVLLLNLSNQEKHNMIHRLPTTATY
jgi:hypothetical protein